MSFFRFVFAALALSSAACRSSISDEPGDVASACRALALASAASEHRCSSLYGSSDVESRVRFCVAMAGAPGSGASVAQLNTCAQTLTGGNCGPVWCATLGAQPTDDAPRGTLAAGAACISSLQCESGQCSGRYGGCGVCQVVVNTVGGACDRVHACGERLECVSGACVRVGIADGQPCASKGDDCNDASFCDGSSGARICVPRVGVGASCASKRCEKELVCHDGGCKSRPLEGESCAAGLPCADDLYCASTGVCAKPLPLGSICLAGESCISGSRCIDLVCRAPLLDQPEGAPCSWGRCAAGLICTMWSCAVGPRAGEPCTADGLCSLGLRCDWVPDRPSVCVPIPRVGESCSLDTHCESGATCAGVSLDPYRRGTCVALPREGQPCADGTHWCAGFLVCNGGRCDYPDVAACAR